MDGWVTSTLDSICEINIGGTPSRNIPAYWDTNNSTENYWVSIKDLNQRTITETHERLTDLGLSNSNAKLIPKGTILLSFKLTIGKVAFAGRDLFTNEAIAGLGNPQIDNDFFYYGLQQWDLLKDVDQAIKGATLNKAKLKQITIKYPKCKQEQSHIAAILSQVDCAIEQTDAKIAKLQRIKAGLMQDLLSRGIDEHGNIRSEETHEFKDSPFGRIPKEWAIVMVLDVAPRDRACIQTGPFGAQLSPKEFQPSGIPVLKIGNVQSGYLNLNTLDYVSEKKAEQLYRFRIEAGDLLFARQGATTGRNALATKLCDGWLINYHIIRVAVDHNKCLPYYLEACFNSHFVKTQVGQSKTRGNRDGINSKDIAELKFPLPSMEEQKIITATLLSLNSSLETSHESLNKYLVLKQGLMQDLLTGKVRVNELLEAQSNKAEA
jgi:type I restriction enzyme S subunit